MLYLEEGNLDGADKILKSLIEKYPVVLDFHLARISVLRKAGKIDEAREVAEKAKKMTEEEEVKNIIDKL